MLSALAGLAARKVTNKDFDEAVKAFNEEHYESALALFNKVVAQKPENGYAWAFIASIKQEGKMTDEALEAAQRRSRQSRLPTLRSWRGPTANSHASMCRDSTPPRHWRN